MPETNPHTESLFWSALTISSVEERARYLDRACGRDQLLRGQIEELLAAYPKAQSFLEHPAHSLTATVDDALALERPGAVVGPYKLLEQIGEGGFGIVFLAEQSQPVRRKVALKVLKAGMDTRQVVARFEAERQALALMDHPNIARVFDGGTSSSGRPYLVMEVVRGVPITEFGDQNRLTIRQRLELFLTVCGAVQHAHQKGVIHRDLKPANVLVARHDTTPVAKVIDFGVAKALGQELTDKTLFTGVAQMVGTPLYMSPEQAGMSGLDVDTRGDIYTLGVLLYELLTGTTPFTTDRLQGVGIDEIRRIIREEEPPRPSTRVTTLGLAAITVSANRGSEPRTLSKLLRGELDWVVMKALEKDRSRRYETAAAFAADVGRYLADEPVLARPPSGLYRLTKFARRNWRALATASALAAALLLAVGSVGWLLGDHAARLARTDHEVEQCLDRVANYHQEGRLPEALAEAQKAKGLLTASGGRAATGHRVAEWLTDLELAVELEELRLLWWDDETRPLGGARLARAFRDHGIDVETLPPEEAARRIRGSRIQADLLATLVYWSAWIKTSRTEESALRNRLQTIALAADPDPWRQRCRQAVAEWDVGTLRQMAASTDPARTPPYSLNMLAASLRAVGDLEGAISVLRAVQRHQPDDVGVNTRLADCLKERLPPNWDEVLTYYRVVLALRPRSAAARHEVGLALSDKGLLDEAIVEYREVLRTWPNALTHYNLGNVLEKKGQHDEAIAEYRASLFLEPGQAGVHVNLGLALLRNGRLDEAIAAYREAIRLKPDYATAHSNLGIALFRKGRLDEGVAECRTALRLEPQQAMTHRALGDALRQQGRLDDAINAYREAIYFEPDDVESHTALAFALARNGRLDEAIDACREAIRLQPGNALANFNLGVYLRRKGRVDEALAAYREAIRFQPGFAMAHDNLGNALQVKGKLKEAEAAHREAIRHQPGLDNAHNNLGIALYRQKRYGEAADAFRQAVAINPTNGSAHTSLGSAFERMGKVALAVASYREAIRLRPASPGAYRGLAWLLATGPDPKLRDGAAAVELATQLGRLTAKDRRYWSILGAAHYRAGNWEHARLALQKAVELNADGVARLFLAMAHWQLGEKEVGRARYHDAVQWMKKNKPDAEDLRRIQPEAAALFGVNDGQE